MPGDRIAPRAGLSSAYPLLPKARLGFAHEEEILVGPLSRRIPEVFDGPSTDQHGQRGAVSTLQSCESLASAQVERLNFSAAAVEALDVAVALGDAQLRQRLQEAGGGELGAVVGGEGETRLATACWKSVEDGSRQTTRPFSTPLSSLLWKHLLRAGLT